MDWRAQVGSRGERLDCKASSEPAEGCDCQALFSTQCHFRFNYTPYQMVRPTVANLAQRVYLLASLLGEREFFKPLYMFRKDTSPSIGLPLICRRFDKEAQTCQIRDFHI